MSSLIVSFGFQPRGGWDGQPDDELAREIEAALTNEPELEADDIEVEVDGGAALVTGVVQTRSARRRVEELVEAVPGVREAHNELAVAR